MKNTFKFIIPLFLITGFTNTVTEYAIVEIAMNATDTAHKKTEGSQTAGIKELLYHCSDNWEKLYAESGNYWNRTGIRGRYQKIKHKIGIHVLQTLLDENVFLAGPHLDAGFMNYQSSHFGKYNPLFLSKLYTELSEIYSDEEFVTNFQHLYNTQLKRYLRTYYISYSYAANNKKYIFKNSPNFDAFATEMDRKGYDWYEAATCPRFWVRRSIDGTSNEFFKLLTLTLTTFDPDFLLENNVQEIKLYDSINYEQWIELQNEEGIDCVAG